MSSLDQRVRDYALGTAWDMPELVREYLETGNPGLARRTRNLCWSAGKQDPNHPAWIVWLLVRIGPDRAAEFIAYESEEFRA